MTIALLLLAGSAGAQASYRSEVDKWRAAHADELTGYDGWLTVAGLYWLNEGSNTVGAGGNYDVLLTDNFAAGKFGEITLSNKTAVLTVAPGVEAYTDGDRVTTIKLVSDVGGKPTRIVFGSQNFYLIDREGKLGIRLKDTKNPARASFKGLAWYPVDPTMRVTATLEAHPKPKEVMIANVIGSAYKAMSPGILRFRLRGKSYSLMPVIEGDHLFIIFRDLTSRTETYGAGRFLYAAAAKDGKVILDFNRAENPPCAYTSFATCPLPPQQNRLNVAIRAGEKRYVR